MEPCRRPRAKAAAGMGRTGRPAVPTVLPAGALLVPEVAVLPVPGLPAPVPSLLLAPVAGLLVPGLLVPGLLVPGLLVPGLVVPGLVMPGLLMPGLMVPGLLVPGLLIPGLVAPPVCAIEYAGMAPANRWGPFLTVFAYRPSQAPGDCPLTAKAPGVGAGLAALIIAVGGCWPCKPELGPRAASVDTCWGGNRRRRGDASKTRDAEREGNRGLQSTRR